MNASTLRAQRREPPSGWPPEVFERVTDALAAALVADVRARLRDEQAEPAPPAETR